MIVTHKAENHLQTLKPKIGAYCLYISVHGGGCSGLSYKMEWVDKYPTDYKVLAGYGPLTVITDAKSNFFLQSVELDFSDDLNDYGFKWKNPNAKKTCGCGESFST